jgi:hypothetical protein
MKLLVPILVLIVAILGLCGGDRCGGSRWGSMTRKTDRSTGTQT